MPSCRTLLQKAFSATTSKPSTTRTATPGRRGTWTGTTSPTLRVYEGAPIVNLPRLSQDPPGGHIALYEPVWPCAPMTLANVAGFLELSVGSSAWKAISGSRWSLRMNPSSGNLHPTETHLVLPDIQGCGRRHLRSIAATRSGTPRRRPPWANFGGRRSRASRLRGVSGGTDQQFGGESWKYGERAFRYCNHDVGHALAALRFAANLLGWRLTCLTGLSDEAVATVLGLQRTPYPSLDEEHPDLICLVHAGGQHPIPQTLPIELVAAFDKIHFTGQPNPLSREHVDWEIIGRAAELKPQAGYVPHGRPCSSGRR